MSQSEPARLAFDDVVIDVAARRVLRGGVEQALEPKAFAVLVLLAASPGRVFSRDEIHDAVWGHRHLTPGVLNRVMTLVRQALGEDAQQPRRLRTVHGAGYRFDLPARKPRRRRGLVGAALALAVVAVFAAWRYVATGYGATTHDEIGEADYERRYLAARALFDRREEVIGEAAERAETEFRALVHARPGDARGHAGLALALDARAHRRPPLAEALRAQSLQAADTAQRIDPALFAPYFVQARAACRDARWDACLALFEKTRALAPNFMPATYEYAMATAQLGYLDRAETALRDAVALDPANPALRQGLGRILDTRGRHDEALVELDRGDHQSAYARWFNAAWRDDHAAALRIAEHAFDGVAAFDAAGPRLKPSYVAVSRALADPAQWPQADAALREYEAKTGQPNFLRVFAPDAPARAAELVAMLAAARSRSSSSWDLLLWTRDLAWLRGDPAFGAYLQDTGILAYWQRHGFPAQCRADGDVAACD